MPARFRDPIAWSRLLQLVKTTAAAVIAWEIALHVLDLRQPFLAPWAALLTVHATVYRTFRRGAQQVGATVLGVLLAFAAGRRARRQRGVARPRACSAGCWPARSAACGRSRRRRPTTALVVLLAGYSDSSAMLVTRLADTGIGVAVGLLVNLLVWAPMGDRIAARHVDAIDGRIGRLLIDVAEGLRATAVGEAELDGWTDRTRDIDRDIDEGWGVVRQARESARLNPRRHAAERARRGVGLRAACSARLEQANAEIRSHGPHDRSRRDGAGHVGPAVRRAVAGAARPGGQRRCATPTPRPWRQVRGDLEGLGHELAGELHGRRGAWPVYGALLVNVRNILEAMGAVADAQPVRPATVLA